MQKARHKATVNAARSLRGHCRMSLPNRRCNNFKPGAPPPSGILQNLIIIKIIVKIRCSYMRNEKISNTRLYKKVKFITRTILEIRTDNLEIRNDNF